MAETHERRQLIQCVDYGSVIPIKCQVCREFPTWVLHAMVLIKLKTVPINKISEKLIVKQ